MLSPDIPFPAIRGGRADVWRRIQAFHRAGIEIHLTCFYDDRPGLRPTEAAEATVRGEVAVLRTIPIGKGAGATFARLLRSPEVPWHARCRTPTPTQRDELIDELRGFSPGLVWLEGPWCGVLGRAAATALGVPLAYRSHNVEHRYMRGQARLAMRLRDRLALRYSCVGLEAFERSLLFGADHVFDISASDLAFWETQGLTRGKWMPPLPEAVLGGRGMQACAPEFDVVFLGNLATPNNVRGIEWLLREIAPRVLAVRPDTGFVIAGSNPNRQVETLCATVPRAQLLRDPPDAFAVLRRARVLVNPVRAGSGVQLKALDMLMTDAPIVSATQGAAGMPDEVKTLFRVADDTDAFAAEILSALASPAVDLDARRRARRHFSVEGVASLVTDIGRESHACAT